MRILLAFLCAGTIACASPAISADMDIAEIRKKLVEQDKRLSEMQRRGTNTNETRTGDVTEDVFYQDLGQGFYIRSLFLYSSGYYSNQLAREPLTPPEAPDKTLEHGPFIPGAKKDPAPPPLLEDESLRSIPGSTDTIPGTLPGEPGEPMPSFLNRK